MVRGTVEKTLDALPEAEADSMCQAQRSSFCIRKAASVIIFPIVHDHGAIMKTTSAPRKRLFLAFFPVVFSLVLSGCDGGNSSGTPTAIHPNSAPEVVDLNIVVQPDGANSGTFTGSDPEGDSLIFSVVDGPSSGSVSLSGPGNRHFDYVPQSGFVGSDSFRYVADDGEEKSGAATVFIVVNTRPEVAAAGYKTSELVSVDSVIKAIDADDDPLTFLVERLPKKGILKKFHAYTGEFSYAPDPASDGVDSFAVTAFDGHQRSAPVETQIEIFRWAGTHQFGSSRSDFATTGGMVFSPGGGLTFGGGTEGDLADVPNGGDYDGYVRKLDLRGNEIWTRQFDDPDGNRVRSVLRVGDTDDVIVLDRYATATLRRFDAGGTEIWRTTVDTGDLEIASPGYWSGADAAGNVYVVSWYLWQGYLYSAVIVKVSGSDGRQLWSRVLEPAPDSRESTFIPNTYDIFVRGIDVNAAGNTIFVGGFLSSSSDQRSCDTCPFVASLDAEGELLWAHEPDLFEHVCDTVPEYPFFRGEFNRVSVGADDELYVVGINKESMFDHDLLRLVRHNYGVVARYSPDGSELIWDYCDDTGDLDSYFYTPPYLAANGDILTYGTVEDVPEPETGEDETAHLVLMRHDRGGTLLWRRTIAPVRLDGTLAITWAGSLVEDDQGLIYVNGRTDGQLTAAAPAGDIDGFVMRLDANGAPR